MTTTEKVYGGIGIALLVLVIGLFFAQKPTDLSLGNVVAGGELQSTTTDSTWNAQALIVGGSKILACGSGMLGSIIINDATAGAFTLYDATSTRNAAVIDSNGQTVGTTTLAKTTASQAENAYPYNSRFKYGLIAEFQTSNVASTTITFRGNPVCQ